MDNKKQITIVFSKKFYSMESIKKTILAYKKFGQFSVKEEKNYIKVNIINPEKKIKDIIKDEFSNYVLAETKNEL
jgi:hypothetical protein